MDNIKYTTIYKMGNTRRRGKDKGTGSIFNRSSVGKELACSAGDLGLIPGSGRSPGGGNGSPLQYPCLENPMARGAWQATAHGVTRAGHELVT